MKVKNKILEVKKKMAENGLSEETKEFLKEADRRFKIIQGNVGYKTYKRRILDFNHQFFEDMVGSGDGLQNSG